MSNTDAMIRLDLEEDESVVSTEAWTVVEMSAQRAFVVNRMPGAKKLTLAPRVGNSDAERIDELAQRRGCRLIKFSQKSAIIAALPTETERVRDEISHALNCRPWDVEISLLDDGNGEMTIIVWRVPSMGLDRRREKFLSIAHDLYADDQNNLWRYERQWLGGANRTVMTYSRDPLSAVHSFPFDFPVSFDAVPLGVAENGEVITYPVVEQSFLFSGLAGSGKSGAQTALLAGLSQLEHTAILAVDAKRVEARLWGPRVSALAVDIHEIDEVLSKTVAEMLRRYKLLESRGLKKIRPSAETPQICVIIDELAEIVGTGLKENKESEERMSSNIRRLMSLGRAAGITVQLATQKPSSDIVPTALRDQVVSRVAFACATDAQVDTILGAGSCHAGARADRIPRNRRGVAYAQTESSREAIRMRTFLIPDEDVASIAESTAHLRVELPWLSGDVDAEAIGDAADDLDELLD